MKENSSTGYNSRRNVTKATRVGVVNEGATLTPALNSMERPSTSGEAVTLCELKIHFDHVSEKRYF
jgi:hypothetical protein